jgi:hypothetical protein
LTQHNKDFNLKSYAEAEVDLRTNGNTQNAHDEPNQFVEKDRTGIEKVISAVALRAKSSTKMTSVSLVIMIVIVFIGGGTSIGTVALNEAGKLRELEIERLKLIKLTNTLTDTSVHKDTAFAHIKKLIGERYGTENSYQKLIEDIQKQSYISWPDIVMRVTIAALTLFLVQVFFHIYKYNRQQSSNLFTKAEILELYKDPEADRDELRRILLSKTDPHLKFEKDPSSPSEQIIQIIEKNKDAKTSRQNF